ncbi:MAG: single-stranded-DNA-specific exonuclease RecJ [bacterium]|nr:single-stranded-DNA-specific exonuclease RecJ [bacterium]
MKKWTLLSEDQSQKTEDGIIKIILSNRGLKTKKEIEEFLNPPNPFTLTASRLDINQKEVDKAVRRIKKAIEKDEKIIVYGDYDTDGVCATAIMWQTLNSLGAKVMPYIPKRDEGYGMKIEKLEEFRKSGVGLIVTVDQGIIACEQVEHANKIGLDVIITDHHLPEREKPKAEAIIHTTELAGAGVAWFLAAKIGKPGRELAAIGTVCDIMPLVGANRSIVKYGLAELRKTKNPGLLALCKEAGIDPLKIGTYEIGYLLGPRINAAGRMDDAMDALRLLCTNNKDRAEEIASKINQHNRNRQLLTEQMTTHARNYWIAEESKGKFIFVSHESYEEGIVGLVAGRLMEEFYLPTVIVSKGAQYSRASARSINGFNMVEAIRACSDILGAHGGHAMAAGFTIETKKLDELKERLILLSEKTLSDELLTPVIKIDLELGCGNLDFSLCKKISEFEPFGISNPEPVFLTRDLTVTDARQVGNKGAHLKLKVSCPDTGKTFDAIGFGFGKHFSQLKPDTVIDLVYYLVEDSWNGQERIQLKLKDLKINNGN